MTPIRSNPDAPVRWRVFPWNAAAANGEPFSLRSVSPARLQQYGRFDLRGRPLVLYLAETPAHAVAEVFRGLRRSMPPGTERHRLRGADLRHPSGHAYALASVRLPDDVEAGIPDLADGATLDRLGIRADQLASRDRAVTQRIARQVYDAPENYSGLRWWSALHGDWHATVLFLDRAPLPVLEFGEPEPLRLDSAAVREAAEFLQLDLESP